MFSWLLDVKTRQNKLNSASGRRPRLLYFCIKIHSWVNFQLRIFIKFIYWVRDDVGLKFSTAGLKVSGYSLYDLSAKCVMIWDWSFLPQAWKLAGTLCMIIISIWYDSAADVNDMFYFQHPAGITVTVQVASRNSVQHIVKRPTHLRGFFRKLRCEQRGRLGKDS